MGIYDPWKDEKQEVLGEVVHQSLRSAACRSSGQHTGVVLNAGAVSHLTDHLHVVLGALLDALSLDELVVCGEIVDALGKLDSWNGEGRYAAAISRWLGENALSALVVTYPEPKK